MHLSTLHAASLFALLSVSGPQIDEAHPGETAAAACGLASIGRTEPGGVLLVRQQAEPLFVNAYGAATHDPTSPYAKETLVRPEGAEACAVRLLALRLEDAHRVQLGDRVSRWLPALQETASSASLADLVTDQALYPDLATLFHFRRREEHGHLDLEQAIQVLGRMRTAGDRPSRATNTLVLVAALEAAAGAPLEELLGDYVVAAANAPPGSIVLGRAASERLQGTIGFRPNRARRARGITTMPLVKDAHDLWLSAAGIAALCDLVIREGASSPLTEGLLWVNDRAHWNRFQRGPAIFLEQSELLVVWASHDRSARSRAIPAEIAEAVSGLACQSSFLRIGGGAGNSFGGTTQPTVFQGRWPVEDYSIVELEQPLRLIHDGSGRLEAWTTGFEPTKVDFGREDLSAESFAGRIWRTTDVGPATVNDPLTGKPFRRLETDTVTITFRRDGRGTPQPVAVSLRTSGATNRCLRDLALMGR